MLQNRRNRQKNTIINKIQSQINLGITNQNTIKTMAYREDFYTVENIIGYTGNVNLNPTVYFQKGNYFGRITQDHSCKDNIGRNEVRFAMDYRIENDGAKAHEFYKGCRRHSSRNIFMKCGKDSLDELSKAIQRFQEEKPKVRRKST